MRHRKKINNLSRKKAHRKSMLANMAVSLIINKRIHTTIAKAKALRVYVEPLITKSKSDTTHSRRTVFRYLQDKEAVSELFRNIAQKIENRPGGYTRILKTGFRLGDSADMCYIELVDYNENLLSASEDKKQTRRRRRGAKKSKTEADATTKEVVDTTVDKPSEDVADQTESIVSDSLNIKEIEEEKGIELTEQEIVFDTTDTGNVKETSNSDHATEQESEEKANNLENKEETTEKIDEDINKESDNQATDEKKQS